MDDRRFVDYFVVTGLPPVSEWQTQRSAMDGQRDAIVDVVVINRTAGEAPPPGFSCVELTASGLSANLNHGSLRAPEMFVCYRRGHDKPPIVDIRFNCFVIFEMSNIDYYYFISFYRIRPCPKPGSRLDRTTPCSFFFRRF